MERILLLNLGGESPLYFMIFLLICGYGFILFFFKFQKPSVKKVENQIMSYFKEEGFSCEKDNGVLYAKVKGHTFSIHLWNMRNPKMKRVYFVYDFVPEKIEDVSFVGLQVLAGCTNVKFPHTTTLWGKDYVVCRYETAISTIDDFEAEFKVGYSQIVEAVNFFYEHYEQIQIDFPAETKKVNKVGFDLNPKE